MDEAEAASREQAGLLGLHNALLDNDFVVGPRELVSAARLIVRLRESGLWREDLSRLQPYLAAVYCKSKDEQERFAQVFPEWVKSRRVPVSLEKRRDPPPDKPVAPPAPPDPPRRWKLVAGAAAGVAVLAGAIAFIALRAPVAVAPAEPAASSATFTPPTTTPDLGTRPADVSAPPPGEGQPDGITGYEPQQRLLRELRPWLVGVLLLLPAPLLLLLYAPALALSRRHVERQRRGGGVRLDVSVWRSEAERIVPELDLETAARLDRHVQPDWDDDSSGSRRVLDPKRTLAATLRRHGKLTLRWRARRSRPSYLVLIDAHDENDLRGRLFFRWADRMRREGVGVEIWLFDGDPRVLYPAHQRRVVDPLGVERNSVRFEHVGARAAADSVRRLVVVGDGSGFFDGAELKPWWPTLGWERWPQRVMFTPVDSRDWGDREVAIERPVARADSGFMVLPLEAEALDAYSVQLTSGELPAIVLSAARRFPPLLERLPQGGLAAEAPAPAEIEKLVAQLRLYLGENGLRWLAACAVPPLTRWELTLLIGQELFRSMGAGDEESLRWLMQTSYARLARLPWLRSASFPSWLALRLLQELSEPEQERVRKIVRTLLEQVPAESIDASRDVLSLDCTPPSGSGGASAGSATPPDEAARSRQWLYLGFLDGLTPRQLAMRAPLAWRQWFARPSGPRSGLAERLRFVWDWIKALVARLMWRDGRRESGTSLLPLVLSVAWIAAVVGALAWADARPDAQLGATLAGALFREQRIDAGAVSDVPVRLAFSGDGSRFASFDASGEVQVRRTDDTASPIGAPIQWREPLAAVFLDGKGERLILVERNGIVARLDVATRRRAEGLDPFAGPGSGVLDPAQTAAKGAPVVGAVLSDSATRLALWKSAREVAVIDFGADTMLQPVIHRIEPAGQATTLKVAFDDTFAFILRGDTLTQADPQGDAVPKPPRARAPGRSWLSPTGSAWALESSSGAVQVTNGDGWFDIESASRPITDIAFGRGGHVAVASGSAVRVLNRFGSLAGSFAATTGDVRRLAFVGDGSALLIADEGPSVTAYKIAGPGDTQDRELMADSLSSAGPTQTRESKGGRATKNAAGVAYSPREIAAFRRMVDTGSLAEPASSAKAASASASLPTTNLADDSPPPILGNPIALGAPLEAWAVSPRGDRIVTANTAHEIRVWQSARLADAPRPDLPTKTPQRLVTLSADGRVGASVGNDRELFVWDVLTGRVRARIPAAGDAAFVALALGADGAYVAGLDTSGRWRSWDATTGAMQDDLFATLKPQALARDASGRTLAIRNGADGTAQVWRFDRGRLRRGAEVKVPNLTRIDLSADGQAMVTLSSSGRTAVWSTINGEQLMALDPNSDLTSGEGSGSTNDAGAAATLTLPSVVGQPLAGARATLAALGFALQVAPSAQPTRLLTGSVLRMSPAAGSSVPRGSTVQLTVVGSACAAGRVVRGAFVGDSACVTVEARDQAQRDNAEAASRVDAVDKRYGPETCAQGFVWREADRPQLGAKFTDKVCVSPAERSRVASDNLRQKENAAPGFAFEPARPTVAVAARSPDFVRDVRFARNADGGALLMARGLQRAIAYGAPGGALMGAPVSHPGISSVDYAPKQNLLVTGSTDGSVRFWNARTGVESLPALRTGAPVVSLKVADDERYVLTNGARGGLRVWDVLARRAVPTTLARTSGLAEPALHGDRVASVDDAGPRIVRLPSETLGALRVIRPYAAIWLAVLALVALGGIVATVLGASRRAERVATFAARTRSADVAADA